MLMSTVALTTAERWRIALGIVLALVWAALMALTLAGVLA